VIGMLVGRDEAESYRVIPTALTTDRCPAAHSD
jgi:hypothetical protein